MSNPPRVDVGESFDQYFNRYLAFCNAQPGSHGASSEEVSRWALEQWRIQTAGNDTVREDGHGHDIIRSSTNSADLTDNRGEPTPARAYAGATYTQSVPPARHSRSQRPVDNEQAPAHSRTENPHVTDPSHAQYTSSVPGEEQVAAHQTREGCTPSRSQGPESNANLRGHRSSRVSNDGCSCCSVC